MYAAIERENPSIEKEIAGGNNAGIQKWLKDNIYQYGRYFSSEELSKKATGESLQSKYFIRYAQKKYNDIYSL